MWLSCIQYIASAQYMVRRFVCADLLAIIKYYVDLSTWITGIGKVNIEYRSVNNSVCCTDQECVHWPYCSFLKITRQTQEQFISPICYNWRHVNYFAPTSNCLHYGFSNRNVPFVLPATYYTFP